MDWKLSALPAYDGGNRIPTLFHCGSGMASDLNGPTDEECMMQLIRETSEEEFLAYCGKLTAAGFACVWQNDAETGLFREFRGSTGVYAYYIRSERTARIIEDKASTPLPEFDGASEVSVHDDTSMMQFGLFYGDMIHGYTCDCGMMYVFRLRNNEVIVVDGGEREQCTEPATEEFMKRLLALTDNPEKITVAAWFCTHAHDDHMDFFGRILKKYGDRIDVKRAMFNFPSYLYLGGRNASWQSEERLRTRLKKMYPEMQYVKLHTGQKFRIANAEFEVLLTHEDILGLHEDNHPYEGMNETSTILRIAFDGASVILLGDAHVSNGNVLIGRYSPQGLRCTFLQAAHHCINNVENIYSLIRTDNVLIPECRFIILRSLYSNYRVIEQYCPERNIHVAGDATSVFHISNGTIRTEYFPVVGCPYDGSEI